MPVKIETATESFNVDDGCGQTLLDLAQEAGLQVNARCASSGICGGCTVRLEQGQFVVADRPVTASPGQSLSVLACKTTLASRDAQIRFPRSSILERGAKIDEDFSVGNFQQQAQTRKHTFSVPVPDSESTLSCWDSIHSELLSQSDLDEIDVPNPCLQKLPDLLHDGDRTLTVTVGRIESRWTVIDFESGDTRASHFGIAVDIGTTTVVAMLIDLNQGQVACKASAYNQQIRQADDVASRISYCQRSRNVRELQRLVIQETINPLIESLCHQKKISLDSIARIAVSGNTVMAHLFLGISPKSIGHVPFQPVANRFAPARAGELKLMSNPCAIVDVVPSVSGYVGGDIVSDIYVAGLRQRSQPTLLVDIGTNGEMVFSEADRYSVCATAAGPAFEGYGTAYGCRAAREPSNTSASAAI